MMKDKRSKNKGILTKIKKAGHRPSKIICPVCKKDLTEALKLVCADFSTHMEVHLQIDTLKIFTYLLSHRTLLPEDLQIKLEQREENIRKLYAYKKELEERDLIGYGGGE